MKRRGIDAVRYLRPTPDILFDTLFIAEYLTLLRYKASTWESNNSTSWK